MHFYNLAIRDYPIQRVLLKAKDALRYSLFWQLHFFGAPPPGRTFRVHFVRLGFKACKMLPHPARSYLSRDPPSTRSVWATDGIVRWQTRGRPRSLAVKPRLYVQIDRLGTSLSSQLSNRRHANRCSKNICSCRRQETTAWFQSCVRILSQSGRVLWRTRCSLSIMRFLEISEWRRLQIWIKRDDARDLDS